MGGKSKQAQRTKNNVRPSNSGRSAELLSQSTGTIPPPTLLAGTGKPLPALFPTLTASTTADTQLSMEYALCFKKLHKKDPITKTKALSELVELVRNSGGEELERVLPHWSGLYRHLSMDTDHRVREATQLCHSAIVSGAGRRLAPYLRLVVPVWVCAQHDPFLPAATHGHTSLHKMFSESKLPEVISFCKTEIVNYLIDNIIGNVEQEIRNKGWSADEVEAAVERRAGAALQGLRYVAQTLPREHWPWLCEATDVLFQTKRYWVLATHKNLIIRSAWCWSVCSVWVAGGAGWRWGARGWGALGGALGAGGAAWPALLHLIYHLPDWHTSIENKKELCDKIIQALESGAGSEGSVVCGCVLPLVAHLPEDLASPSFYQRLFIALFTGLIKKQTLLSKTERQNWIRSISECVRYASIQSGDWVNDTVTSAHRRWLEVSLAVSTRAVVRETAVHLCQLVQYWHRENKQHLVRNHWNNVATSLLSQLDHLTPETTSAVVEGQVSLLTSLKAALHHNDKKKKKSIRFQDEVGRGQGEEEQTEIDEREKEKETEVIKEPPLKETEQPDKSFVDQYLHNLDEVAERIVTRYLELAKEDGNTVFVGGAVEVVEGAGGGRAVGRFGGAVGRWLRGGAVGGAHVQVFGLLLGRLGAGERAQLLRDLQIPLLSPAASWVCVRLSECSWKEKEIYLRSPHTTQLVLRLVKLHLDRPDSGHKDTLYALLRKDAQGEVIVSEECVREVVSCVLSAMKEVLSRETCEVSPEVTSLAALTAHLLIHLHIDKELLLGLARLCTNITSEMESCGSVRSYLSEVISTLPAELRGRVGAEFVALLHTARDSHVPAHSVSVPYIEYLVSTLQEFLSDCSPAVRSSLVELAFTAPSDSMSLEYYALRADIVRGNLVCPLRDMSPYSCTCARSECVCAGELCVGSVCVWGRGVVWDLVRTDRDLVRTDRDLVRTDRDLVRTVRDLAVLRAVYDNYRSWYEWSVVRDVYNICESEVRKVVQGRPRLLTQARTLAHAHGEYYAYGLRYLEEVLGENGTEPTDTDTPSIEDSLTADGYFHTLQARGDPISLYSTAVRCAALRLRAVNSDTSRAALLHLVQSAILTPPEKQLELFHYVHYNMCKLYLYNQDVSISEMEWSDVWSLVSVVRVATRLVGTAGWDVSPLSWDFVLLTTHVLAHDLAHSLGHGGNLKTCMLSVAVSECVRCISEFIRSVPLECERRTPAEHIAALPREWADLFQDTIHTHLRTVVLYILGLPPPTPLPLTAATWALLAPPPRPLPPPPPLPPLLSPLVASPPPHISTLLLAYFTLDAYRDEYVLQDAESVAAWGAVEGEEDEERPPPPLSIHLLLAHLEEQLPRVQHYTQHLTPFSGVREWTPVEPQYGEVMQFTLGALVLLEQMRRSRGDLWHLYSRAFRASPLCDLLMDTAGRVAGWVTSEEVLTAPLDRLGALERGVWGGLGAHVAARAAWAAGAGGAAGGGPWWRAVGATLATRRDLGAATRHPFPPDLLVTAAPPDLTARLTLEERPVELTLRLSPLHPRAPPTVSVSGAAEAGWVALLAWRGGAGGAGAVAGALRAWRDSLLGLVARSPQCYICYCTLHPGSGRPPKVSCHHCKNKFHKECIRKWFSTSNKSSCPICRSVF